LGKRVGNLFIYLFIYSNGGYVNSVIQPFSPLPPSIFGLQMLKKKLRISKNGALPFLIVDHSMCRNDGEIILCDKDVSQDDHVQQGDECLQRPRFLAGHVNLKFIFSYVFAMFLLPVPQISSSQNLSVFDFDIQV